MQILFLTQIIPYPPDAGPKVKTWHVLRYLASRGHRIILASFIRPEEEEHVLALQEVCQQVYTVPIRRSRLADVGYWVRSHFTGRPFLIERDDLVGMREVVSNIMETEKIDVVHADQLTMTQFGLPYCGQFYDRSPMGNEGHHYVLKKRPLLVFDAHNAVWTIVERMRQNAPWFLKPVEGLEANRIKRYEGMIVDQFDLTLAVAEPDRLALKNAVEYYSDGTHEPSISILVVPIAVDTQQLQPVRRSPGSKNIVTLGTLHYPPNADGIRWFAQEVFPLIRQIDPEVTLTILGKNPPADFYQLQAKNPSVIEVTGYVQDLTPYLERAALMVIAVRAGGGMRVRILEAFARGMPVVTTTVGLEGIEAQAEEQILVEDTPEAFAKATLRVLQDGQLGYRLAENGRRLAEEMYDWQVVLTKMDAIYNR
jgi:glycosyltransferase involved in cell wall biosynthesis